MGRRPGNPESGWASGLGENDPGDVGELTANLVDQHLARLGMRFAAGLARDQHRLDASRGRADKLRRAAIEPAAAGLAGFVPSRGDSLVIGSVGGRAVAERLDKANRMADRREARYGLGIGPSTDGSGAGEGNR